MSHFREHLLVYLLVITIIVICGLIFPRPTNNILLVILLASVCMMLFILFNPYQVSQFSININKAIKPYRFFVNIFINSLMLFSIISFVFFILIHTFKNTIAVPIDYWYILALLILWFVILREYVLIDKKWEATAIAATCIPFSNQNHKIKTIMIYNTNFQQWMFPGGHVKSEFPEDVAIRKAATEAGIEVTLIKSFDIIIEYSHCKPKNSPFFVYHLFIDEEARCIRNYGHEYHIDFTYIGEFEKIKGGGIFDIIQIDIEPQCTDVSTIRECIHKSLVKKYLAENKPPPKQLYPEDIPDRLLVAFNAYKSVTGH